MASRWARRLVAATCVLLVRCSASLRVALCVTGQLRTFNNTAVRESQANRLVGDLRRQASLLDSFLVVSEAAAPASGGASAAEVVRRVHARTRLTNRNATNYAAWAANAAAVAAVGALVARPPGPVPLAPQ